MPTLYLDLETYSRIDLTKCGVYRYSEDVEILLFAYALDDGMIDVWDVTADSNLPDSLVKYATEADYFCAHNSRFDRIVLEKVLPGFVIGAKWRDTMVRAYQHGLPGGLKTLCEIYDLPVDKAKDAAGRKLIHLFCKPTKEGERNNSKTHPEEWAKFVEYARLDIAAMRELDKKIPRWNDEYDLWQLDQKINDRGFQVDLDLAHAAIETMARHKIITDKQTVEKTNGEVNSATQRDALLEHILNEYGVALPNMQQSTLERRMNDENLPQEVRDLIALRLASSGTSTKKYNVIADACCPDGRMRGTLQFCGAARSGREGGRLFQPQNLPRPTLKSKEIETAIELVKSNCLDLIYDNIPEILTSAIRGLLIAAPKKKLVISDLSAIEGRVLAWLADEEWKLQAYRDLDEGKSVYDLYVLAYAKSFNVEPSTVTKSQRQLGKTLELALGYAGGVGAFVTFANTFGIDLNDIAKTLETPGRIKTEALEFWEYCVKNKKTLGLTREVFVACDSLKRMWREANPKIVQFWKDIDNATISALNTKDEYKVGMLSFDKKGSWLRIKLPSGRYMCYAGAKIIDGKIKYLGMNTYSKKWGFQNTYAGKICENVTQATARDILFYSMPEIERQGYEIVLHVHDEIIAESPDTNEYSADKLSAIMSKGFEWSKGLPLNAAGFESYRYRKE